MSNSISIPKFAKPSGLSSNGLMQAEQQRVIATIQAALTVAAARPRDEDYACKKIIDACKRQGVAEKAEYSYSKGGTDIAGASIELMTVIANAWGNIDFGFRELSQENGESVVECFAWDLETNSKRTITVKVPHNVKAKGKIKTLEDPREIYEHVANFAQRRVRACLEAVIPTDVVEMARLQCRQTLQENDPLNPEKIAKLVETFEKKFGVTREQIEKRLLRKVEAITQAQMIQMKHIWKSLNDGMSQVSDWFDVPETPVEPTPKITEERGRLAELISSATSLPKLAEARSEVMESKLSADDKSELLSHISEYEAELSGDESA